MGRKKIELDWKLLDGILQVGSSNQMCSDVLNVSIDTIERRIREEHDMTFIQYRTKRMSNTKVKLQQKAITKALSGDNTMLIFCLKNICGWADKVESQHSGEATIKIDRDDEQL